MELIAPEKFLEVFRASDHCATGKEIAEKVGLDEETVEKILDILNELGVLAKTDSGLVCSCDAVRRMQEQLIKH